MWITDTLHDWMYSPEGARLLLDGTRWFEWKEKRSDPSRAELREFLEKILEFNGVEFRNIVDYRLKCSNRRDLIPNPNRPRESTLFLNCKDIGGGLIVQHGHSTHIFARKIGKNFHINQNVTIGSKNGSGSPTIGDNVSVLTGAIVIGGVSIGDNSVITANAVVSFDVPEDCKVYPAKSTIVQMRR